MYKDLLNRKGQSLITFILIFPIIFLILFLVVNIGIIYSKKIELDNINYIALDYGLDNIDEEDIDEKIKNIINKNISDCIIEIKIEEDKIFIKISKEKNTIINSNIISSYVGYIDQDSKRIEKKSW